MHTPGVWGGPCTRHVQGVHALGVWGVHAPGMCGGPCTGCAWGVNAPDMHGGAHTGHAWGVHTPGVLGGSMHWVCGGCMHQASVGGACTRRLWGKNQDFMLVRFSKASNLIGCGGDT